MASYRPAAETRVHGRLTAPVNETRQERMFLNLTRTDSCVVTEWSRSRRSSPVTSGRWTSTAKINLRSD